MYRFLDIPVIFGTDIEGGQRIDAACHVPMRMPVNIAPGCWLELTEPSASEPANFPTDFA